MLGAASTCSRISCEGGAEQSCAARAIQTCPGSQLAVALPAAGRRGCWPFLFLRPCGLKGCLPTHVFPCLGGVPPTVMGIIDAVDAFRVGRRIDLKGGTVRLEFDVLLLR